MPDSIQNPVGSDGSWASRLFRIQATPVLLATAALLVVAAVVAPRLFTPASIIAIVIPSGILAIAAIGQTLVIQQKGIDLSAGGMITLSAVSIGAVRGAGGDLWLALVVVALLAVLAGLLNGLLVSALHITPILATLASNSLLIGVVWTMSGGAAQTSPRELVTIASASVFGFPAIGWIAVLLVAVMALLMGNTSFGRRFTGVGSSAAAARASGVVVERHVVFGYVASSGAAALAGVLLAGYAGQLTYDIGSSYQLPVIAAVVVGGASLAGGRGSVVATAIGCLLLTLVVQMVLTLGAPESIQLLVQSIVLAVAAMVRVVPWGRISRVVRPRRPTPEGVPA